MGLRFFTSLRCVQNDMVGCSPLGIKGEGLCCIPSGPLALREGDSSLRSE